MRSLACRRFDQREFELAAGRQLRQVEDRAVERVVTTALGGRADPAQLAFESNKPIAC